MFKSVARKGIQLKKPLLDYGIILVIGFIVLVASHYYISPRLTWGDEIITATEARNLVTGRGLVSNFTVPENIIAAQHLTSDVHMPGMALAIALSYKMFQISDWAALLPNQIAYLVTGMILLWLGKKYANRNTGVYAACLFFIFPSIVVYAHSAMTELMIVFLASAWCACWFSYISTPHLKSVLGMGALLILGALFRETFLVLLPITVWSLIAVRTEKRFLYAYVFSTLFISFFFALIVPLFLTKGLYPHSLTTLMDLPGFGQKFHHMISRFAPNIRDFFWQSAYPQQLMAWPIAAVTILIAMYGRKLNSKMQRISLVYISVFSLLFILVCLLYRFDYWSGVRVLLMCAPMACIILASIFTQKLFSKKWIYAISLVLLLSSLMLVINFTNSRKHDTRSQQKLTSIIPPNAQHGRNAVLADGAFRYGWEQYPVVVIWQSPKNASAFIKLYSLLPMNVILLDYNQKNELSKDSGAASILSNFTEKKIDDEKFIYTR